MMWNHKDLEQKCINTIRFLAADTIEKAKSGHPGMPMGAAAAAYALWVRHLKHNPSNPAWPDRDRFVLSAGHGSALLYALLFLTGYDLSLDDLQSFRRWGSRTPGHPERGDTAGVEITTGPLGQGLACAVGMAIAEAHLAACFNRPGFPVIDHHTYVLASDGDMMEGISAEACALAGHLALGKLIVLYDDNGITLAGSKGLAFTENISLRFAAAGWHVLEVKDGGDAEAVDEALRQAREETHRPSLICLQTVIGAGAPKKQGTFGVHGTPLGPDELKAAKENLGWPLQPPFHLPEEALRVFREAKTQGVLREEEWRSLFAGYRQHDPEKAQMLERILAGDLPPDWEAALPRFAEGTPDMATRKACETVLQALAEEIPELIGGSADLNPSTLTWLKSRGDFQSPLRSREGVQGRVGGEWGYGGRNIHFGVREHAMAAICSGLAAHGGLIPYAATFFTFSDYMRPAIRLAALMRLRIVYVFSHDSIGVGEDGPTHEPVEHLMSLRTIPHLTVIRPSDAAEVAEAWRMALLDAAGPTAIVLTRQNVPLLKRSDFAPADGLRQGGYVLWESRPGPSDLVLLATGSEVAETLAAAQMLAADGCSLRVVALPSWELFDRQASAYREHVLPSMVRRRVAVEAGIRLGWEHYVGLDGLIIGLDGFGASAPHTVLFERFGLTAARIYEKAAAYLKENR